jgi:large subunit ribosomal protein L25
MITLSAVARDVKVNPKMIRRAGSIPAVFYGASQQSTSISVNAIAFMKAYKAAGESTIITLSVDGKTMDALIHDVDLDPVVGEPIHVDFYIVAKDHKIEVEIPLEFIGVAPAEKVGGVVLKIMHEVRIESLPGKLPAHLTVDLSVLTAIGSHITVGDLKLPEGVRAIDAASEVIANVSGQKDETNDAPTAIDMSAIEVEKKGKKEDEEEAA